MSTLTGQAARRSTCVLWLSAQCRGVDCRCADPIPDDSTGRAGDSMTPAPARPVVPAARETR